MADLETPALDAIKSRLTWPSLHWGIEGVSTDAWPHISRAALTGAMQALHAQGLLRSPAAAPTDHLLIVTVSPEPDDDDVEYSVVCPGTNASPCEVWNACPAEDCQRRPSPYDPEVPEEDSGVEDFTSHGRFHQWLETEWMFSTGRCAWQEGSVAEWLHDIARQRGVGVWPIEIDYSGDGDWFAIDLTDLRIEEQA